MTGEFITAEAMGRGRQAAHGNDPGETAYRETPAKAHQIGVAGEIAFAARFGLPLDTAMRPSGDAGVDFQTGLGVIQVKTSKLGVDLLVQQRLVEKHGWARYYVLAQFDEVTKTARLLGWTTDTVVRMAVQIRIRLGVSYRVLREHLAPMNHLAFRGGLTDYAPDAYCCEIHPAFWCRNVGVK